MVLRPIRIVALLVALLATAAAAALGACGGDDPPQRAETTPQLGRSGAEPQAASRLGFPAFATKNTTRIAGADPTADAAGAAQAVFPAQSPATRPRAVALVDGGSWQAAVAGSVLAAKPLGAPTLLANGDQLPPATSDALQALAPRGAPRARDAQVLRVGTAATPQGLKTVDVARARAPAVLAGAIDDFRAAVTGRRSAAVVVVSDDAPAFAMPAAAWAAKSGDSVLFVERDRVPDETRRALAARKAPRIVLLGPERVVSPATERALRRLGAVARVQGPTPAENAVAFARFRRGGVGWGVLDPGHGLSFASAERPLDVAAAGPLAAAGTYAPLLVLQGDGLPKPVADFLLDIQPGYARDPVRGVYNHGWLIGDASAISVPVQSQIDALLEIAPVRE